MPFLSHAFHSIKNFLLVSILGSFPRSKLSRPHLEENLGSTLFEEAFRKATRNKVRNKRNAFVNFTLCSIMDATNLPLCWTKRFQKRLERFVPLLLYRTLSHAILFATDRGKAFFLFATNPRTRSQLFHKKRKSKKSTTTKRNEIKTKREKSEGGTFPRRAQKLDVTGGYNGASRAL